MEMVVVVAIVVITFTLLVPNLGLFRQASSLKSSSQQLVSALHNARSLAITQQEIYAVVFELETDPTQFWVASWDDENNPSEDPTDSQTYTPWDLTDRKMKLPDHVIITDFSNDGTRAGSSLIPDMLVAFTPRGTASSLRASNFETYEPYTPPEDMLPIAIHIWNIGLEAGSEVNTLSELGMRLAPFDFSGMPPGVAFRNPASFDPTDMLDVQDNNMDVYYFTIEINQITGHVSAFDYARGNPWNKAKDGA